MYEAHLTVSCVNRVEDNDGEHAIVEFRDSANRYTGDQYEVNGVTLVIPSFGFKPGTRFKIVLTPES